MLENIGAKIKHMKPTLRFTTTLSGSILSFPKTVSAKLPNESIKIEGIMNCLPFQSIAEFNKESQSLKLTSAMKNALRISDGDSVGIEITRVGNESEIRVPTDLQKVIKNNGKAWATWTDITPLARRDWIFWMIMAKKAQTRERHIEKMIDMLSHGKRRVCCFAGVQWITK